MKQSFSQLQKQIQVLTAQAEAARQRELADVIQRIKEAVGAYGITAEDLGFGKATRSLTATKTRGPKKSIGKSKAKSVTAKFRDDQGNTWVGRGPRPHWLRDALSAGKSLQDFAVSA